MDRFSIFYDCDLFFNCLFYPKERKSLMLLFVVVLKLEEFPPILDYSL